MSLQKRGIPKRYELQNLRGNEEGQMMQNEKVNNRPTELTTSKTPRSPRPPTAVARALVGAVAKTPGSCSSVAQAMR